MFDERRRRARRGRRQGNRLADAVVSQPDGQQAHAALAEVLRRGHREAVVITAVGNQQQVLEVGRPVVEYLIADRPQGIADQRAAARHAGDGKLLHREAEEPVVEGKGALDHRAAGERHQRHAVAGQLLERIENRELGAFQAIGGQILGQHAARHVDHEHHVAPAALHRGGLRLPPRARGGHHRGREPQQRERRQQRPQVGGRVGRGRGGAKPPRGAAARAPGQQPRRRRRQQQPQQQERLRMDEAEADLARNHRHHGLRRNRVALSSAAPAIASAAANASGTNRSR